ncbi:hypothetical protein [Streptomyces canus]|nr:hypothetical protein [Streptomyces canus]MDQ0763913.1 hypothetical protein [Streptomyces canus]
MATVTAAKTVTDIAGLPEVAAPSRVAPKDARELSRLFCTAKAAVGAAF